MKPSPRTFDDGGPRAPRRATLRSASVVLFAALGGLLALPPTRASGQQLVRPATSSSASASASASARAPGRHTGFAPDPPPLVSRRKWVYDVIWHEGALFVPTPVAIEKARPTETPRVMGRFHLELYVGPELLERVRFEIPLLGGDGFSGEKRPFGAPPDFERKLHARARVEVPDSDRATYAVLTDRATGKRVRVPWPRVDGPFPAPAGSSSAAPAASSAAPAASAP